MNSESFNPRTILAIVVCVIIFVVWQKQVSRRQSEYLKYKKELEQKKEEKNDNVEKFEKQETMMRTVTTAPQSEVVKKGIRRSSKKILKREANEEEFIYQNPLFKVVFSSRGASVKAFILLNYRGEGNDIDVLGKREFPPYAYTVTSGEKQEERNYRLVEMKEWECVFRSGNRKKTYRFFPGKYYFDININGENLKNPIVTIIDKYEEVKSSFLKPAALSNIRALTYAGVGKVRNEDFKSIGKLETEEKSNIIVNWVSLGNKYFTNSLILIDGKKGRLKFDRIEDTIVSHVEIQGGNEIRFVGFVGPKEIEILKGVDEFVGSMDLSFEKNLDYGWFSFLAVPLLKILRFLYGIVQNWGLAIIILTILIKIVLFPLTHKSYKAMKDMQLIQPELKKIKEQFKDDREALNKETMLVMKRNKVNPMGSCFPMLLQMPVFFALYRVFAGSVELYRAPFWLWITDLSVMDKYWVLPIMMGLGMVVQQRMTPSTADPMQAKVMMFMPVMFTVIMITLPAGLNLYFLVNTGFSILQQTFIQKNIRGKEGGLIGGLIGRLIGKTKSV